MKRYGLLGAKLKHSFSREIHKAIGGYDYDLIELTESGLRDFLTRKEFSAVNVTIPYKKTVIPYLDELTEEAAAIGAVNCIRNDGGRLTGHNTDFGGLKALLLRLNADINGNKILIAGTGGTSDTAAAVCRSMGASAIIRASRAPGMQESPSQSETVTYAAAADKHSDASVIINTTPCGMYPEIFESPINLDSFDHAKTVIDVIYNPLRTKLVSSALRRGIRAEGGLYMLVAQAVKASEFFFGKRYENGLTDSIYDKTYRQKSNIILTGMPSCGKTTIAGLLAKKTGRPVYDIDAIIEKKAGMKISDIFARYGEKHFRDLETEAIREAAAVSSSVIATGGGAVLREENIRALKMNGEIFFIDRDPSLLTPTDDRPLARNSAAVRERYAERYPLYISTADHRTENNGPAEKAADAILEVYT